VILNFNCLIDIVFYIVAQKLLFDSKSKEKFRSFMELTRHVTVRSERQPCSICNTEILIKNKNQLFSYYTKKGKVCAYYRIN